MPDAVARVRSKRPAHQSEACPTESEPEREWGFQREVRAKRGAMKSRGYDRTLR